MSLFRRALDWWKLRTMDEFESLELREWFARDFHVEVGLYSYGCFDRWRIPARTRIGRYCSFARSARVLDANHPFDALSTHPFLYEKKFGLVDRDLIDPPWLTIEDDVWVSHNATITPSCKFVGRGAIIGAGAIVTKDVPRYTIMVGAPAAPLRKRFPQDLEVAIEESRWWEMTRADSQAVLQPSVERLAALARRRP
jgi:virginiamycin A acetyltransferase